MSKGYRWGSCTCGSEKSMASYAGGGMSYIVSAYDDRDPPGACAKESMPASAIGWACAGLSIGW